MFAGGDYSRAGCSVSEVTDLYISLQKQQPLRVTLPTPNISQPRANLAGNRSHLHLSLKQALIRRAAGTGLSWPVNPSTGLRQPGYFAFAGGLTCTQGGKYPPSDVIDIFWYDKSKESTSVSPWTLAAFDLSKSIKLSSPRNWMSATTFCTLAKTGGSAAVPLCRFMFAGGQGDGNQYSNVVHILDASACYTSQGLSADPNTCMQMGPSINMAIARGSLAVASFLGAGNIGGGAAMFAGGKTEVKTALGNTVPVTWATSDYYISASATSPILDLAWFNLSVPRFDLAGVGFDISGSGGKQQALFAGGTTSDLQTSNVVDSYLFGSAIPDMCDPPFHA